MMLSLAAALALCQTAPTKVAIEFESAQQVNEIPGLIKSVAGVEDCTSERAKIVFTVKVGEQVKLSDIKKVLATLKPKPSIKYETLKLEGVITLKFDRLQDNDYTKVQRGLWRATNVVSAELGILGYDCKFKAPGSPIVEIAKLVALWSGSADTGATTMEAMSYVYQVIWHGPEKPKELAAAQPSSASARAPAPKRIVVKLPEPKPDPKLMVAPARPPPSNLERDE